MGNVNPGILDGVRRIGMRVRDLAVEGALPGAPLGLRLRGATAAGPPQGGTWKAGDVVPDRRGTVWTCTTGGEAPAAAWSGAIAGVTYITLPAGWYGGAWFTSKAAGFASPATLACIGDSVTNGINASGGGFIATGWPDQLRTLLLAGSNTPLYADFYPGWSYNTGAGAIDSVGEGFPAFTGGSTTYEAGFGTVLAPATTSAWVQTISTGSIPGWTGGNCTGFDFVYFDFSANGWAFQIDGGQGGSPTVTGAAWSAGNGWYAVTNTGGGATGGNIKKVTVRGLTSGTHTIQWGQLAAAACMFPIGISLYTGSAGGIGFVRSGYSGRRAVDTASPAGTSLGYAGTLNTYVSDRIAPWSGAGPEGGTAQISPVPFGFPMQPSLAFVSFGINDCANGISPAAYTAALYRYIQALKRGTPKANIAIVALCNPDPYYTDNNIASNAYRYVLWKQAMAETAAAYSCAYVDIDTLFGATPVASGYMVSGNVHPTTAGHLLIAQTVQAIT